MKACEAFRQAWAQGRPYDLICMDIQMPRMDGQEAVRVIRQWEQQRGILLDAIRPLSMCA